MTKKATTKDKNSVKKRRLKQPNYKSLRLSKRIKYPGPPIPSVWKLSMATYRRLRASPRLFIYIVLIYGLLTVLFVRGLGSSLNIAALKSNFQELFQGSWGQLSTGFTLFGLLLGSIGGGTGPTASLYQSILIVIFSLVFIWSLRQVQAGHQIGLRDVFYKSMYPLIQFLLVLVVIALQLVPLLIGSALYTLVINNGIAVSGVERFVWALLFFMMALLSLYMLCSSLFALYIVTLPNMTPMKSLRSARELVRYRRWTILRKIIYLPVALLILGALVVIPVILIWAPAAQWVFFVGTMASLAIVHSYLYNLYRELL